MGTKNKNKLKKPTPPPQRVIREGVDPPKPPNYRG